MYTLREADPDDVEAIQVIDCLYAPNPHPAELLRNAISQGKVVIAELEREVVAYVRWDYFWDSIPLCLMARVKPEHQRRGIGCRLLEHIEAGFRERGHTFWLSSTEEINERSRSFHEACGFRPIGKLAELGQDMREIFYRKDLS